MLFRQQIIGTINLGLPIILLYQICPTFVFSIPGILACAVAVGAYVYWMGRRRTKLMLKNLNYAPTGIFKDDFEAVIRACEQVPENIKLNYAYAGEIVALAAYDTIVIDPIVWHGVNEDPEAQKVHGVFDSTIAPHLSELQKTRLGILKEILTPAAQQFILRHEIGHIVLKYSAKTMAVLFVTACLSVICGITCAQILYPLTGGIIAAVVALLIGGITDLLLTGLTNFFFKVRLEEQADRFAVAYSTQEEILAAADFFEKHQQMVNAHKDAKDFLAWLPGTITTGHPDGVERARALRIMAK